MSKLNYYTANDMRRYADCIYEYGVNYIVREGLQSYIIEALRQAADTEDEKAQLEARLESVVKKCECEISSRQKTDARCKMCMEDSSAGEDCPYCGEPNGCNSPTYGEFPTEKGCGPFNEIIRAARGEGGVK